jgi:hypothetical protein
LGSNAARSTLRLGRTRVMSAKVTPLAASAFVETQTF